MPSTSPDNIYYPDINAAQNQPAYMGTHATSVQTALSLRQRYSFIWANDAARLAQTGMTEGSIAYQVDSKTEYQYENGIWRLGTPHVEFTSSASIPNASPTLAGVFSVDNTRTSAPTMATPFSNGVINVSLPGIYAISTRTLLGAAATNRTFIEGFDDTAGLGLSRVSIGVGEDEGTLSVPNAYIIVPNTRLRFNVFQQTGGTRTVSTRLRITRIG
jgi:hypothetical protein